MGGPGLAVPENRGCCCPEPATPDGPRRRGDGKTALANRLRRLEAIREAAQPLMNRPQFQRDISSPRGNPESIAENPSSQIHRDAVSIC